MGIAFGQQIAKFFKLSLHPQGRSRNGPAADHFPQVGHGGVGVDGNIRIEICWYRNIRRTKAPSADQQQCEQDHNRRRQQ